MDPDAEIVYLAADLFDLTLTVEAVHAWPAATRRAFLDRALARLQQQIRMYHAEGLLPDGTAWMYGWTTPYEPPDGYHLS